jgi:hypothetical protein
MRQKLAFDQTAAPVPEIKDYKDYRARAKGGSWELQNVNRIRKRILVIN